MGPYTGVDYVYSRVDSNTFTMGNPMPESTLSPCQRQGRWIWSLANYVLLGNLKLVSTRDGPLPDVVGTIDGGLGLTRCLALEIQAARGWAIWLLPG